MDKTQQNDKNFQIKIKTKCKNKNEIKIGKNCID